MVDLRSLQIAVPIHVYVYDIISLYKRVHIYIYIYLQHLTSLYLFSSGILYPSHVRSDLKSKAMYTSKPYHDMLAYIEMIWRWLGLIWVHCRYSTVYDTSKYIVIKRHHPRITSDMILQKLQHLKLYSFCWRPATIVSRSVPWFSMNCGPSCVRRYSKGIKYLIGGENWKYDRPKISLRLFGWGKDKKWIVFFCTKKNWGQCQINLSLRLSNHLKDRICFHHLKHPTVTALLLFWIQTKGVGPSSVPHSGATW